MEFSKLFCCKYLYIELYRIGLDYRTGFKFYFDRCIIRCSISIIGLTLHVEIGKDCSI